MSKKQKAMDNIFECFKKEGRELGIMETKRLYPRELSDLRKASFGSNVRVLFSRMRKIYADRWHEIYDKEVVHEKVSKPAQDPLEKLRVATRKVNE